MKTVDVVIVGGGIAGLATAWHLAQNGRFRTCLIERERTLASHASGRNAAIFRHLEGDALSAQLALRTRELFGLLREHDPRLIQPDSPLIRRTGALYLGTQQLLQPLMDLGGHLGIEVEWLGPEAIHSRIPILEGGSAQLGLMVEDDGVIDIHALTETLAQGVRQAGNSILIGATVVSILKRGETLYGVRLADGTEIHAAAIVIAAGAWSADLGAACDATMPIQPYRRHLVMLEPAPYLPKLGPIVWRLDEEVYFRWESGGILASPCDEEGWAAGTPPSSPEQLTRLAARLARTAPLVATAYVKSAWACLRSHAADRQFVAGKDPRYTNLFWIGALGGRGMTCGLALGEVVADHILGKPHTEAAALSPARLFARSQT